ncbi:S8 family serine peptidase [Candidatus Ozemobacteraceae bacterium]|nr:S8 family serine peptidase [Candidatus Ozemobacteraceae bacterium]
MKKVLSSLAIALATFVAGGTAFADVVPGKYLVLFKSTKAVQRGSHAQVVRGLQKANKSNIDLLQQKIARKGDSITPLWNVNGAVVKASKSELETIKSLGNVASVKPVEYKKWLNPRPSTRVIREDAAPVWNIVKVRAPEVWKDYNIDGSGIVVGHLDTGAAAAHPALKGKVIAFKDFTPAAKPESYDDQGHGSHTAGTIAGGNGLGVAPGARLIVAKVFDKQGGAEDAWLLQAMQWVMDPDGNPETNDAPLLVSNSWGSDDSTDKVFWDAVNAWVTAGMVPVFAAGNNGPSGKVGTPGGFPHSWAVAATKKDDTIAYFSSVGPVVWDGVTLVKPDIAAPGYGVISCNTGDGTVSNMGTSMACPHVAGLVALMLQANPKLTIEQVRSLAESTAIDLGTAGKDNKFGSGRFDAVECIKKVLETSSMEAAFAAYDRALSAEVALVGVQQVSPLAAPLARSLVLRCQDLDDGEFRALSIAVENGGSQAGMKLIKEAAALRQAENLQK